MSKTSPRLRLLILYTLVLWMVFGFHRWLSLPYLTATKLQDGMLVETLIVGLSSDFWVAFLWMFVWFFGSSAFGYMSRKRFPESFLIHASLPIAASATALHQGYVEFFRHQVLPLHIAYLVDWDFINAQAGSAVSVSTIAIFVACCVGQLLALFASRIFQRSEDLRTVNVAVTLLLLASIALHKVNIHYRVQWFVPVPLQLNYLESLVYLSQTNPIASPLSLVERTNLAEAFNLPNARKDQDLVKIVTHQQVATTAPSDPHNLALMSTPSMQAWSLQQAVHRSIRLGHAPLVLLVLLEGHRPSEIGFMSQSYPSLSPHLDKLSRNAISFHNAYSTSNVTRGGQEAVFCGYPSSAHQSMMRNNTGMVIPCLPQLLSHIPTFWFHGGNGNFDQQLSFWRAQGVDYTLTQDDFPKEATRTAWGISDRALFHKSLQSLDALRNQHPKTPLLGMILTLSNHIPWAIPLDAPLDLAMRAETLKELNFGTSLYADHALGEFIENLANSHHWEHTLLILASDHGVAGTAYLETEDKPLQQSNDKTKDDKRKSHIVLMLAGGLVEQSGYAGTNQYDFVSQADVAPFIYYLLDDQHQNQKPQKFMSEMLLSTYRHRPVFSDLASSVYFPKQNLSFSPKDLNEEPASHRSPTTALNISYYRSIRQALRSSKRD